MTWSPENEDFVKPFIYGFKGGRAIAAASRLATIFLSHKQISFGAGGGPGSSVVVQAPASTFDHSSLWAHVLAEPMGTHSLAALRDVTPAGFDKAPDQKRRRQGERANRRFEMREHFAGFFDPSTVGCVSPSASADHPRPPKRIVFADDVITSGATAMAAYMALGDPDEFEVWTLVARPRLAGS